MSSPLMGGQHGSRASPKQKRGELGAPGGSATHLRSGVFPAGCPTRPDFGGVGLLTSTDSRRFTTRIVHPPSTHDQCPILERHRLLSFRRASESSCDCLGSALSSPQVKGFVCPHVAAQAAFASRSLTTRRRHSCSRPDFDCFLR